MDDSQHDKMSYTVLHLEFSVSLTISLDNPFHYTCSDYLWIWPSRISEISDVWCYNNQSSLNRFDDDKIKPCYLNPTRLGIIPHFFSIMISSSI